MQRTVVTVWAVAVTALLVAWIVLLAMQPTPGDGTAASLIAARIEHYGR